MSVKDLTELANSLPSIIGSAQNYDGDRFRLDKLDDLNPIHRGVRALRKLESMWTNNQMGLVLVLWLQYVRAAGTLPPYEIARTLASTKLLSEWGKLKTAARRAVADQWGVKILAAAVDAYRAAQPVTITQRNLSAFTGECDERLVTGYLRKQRREQRKEKQIRSRPDVAAALAQLERLNPKATEAEKKALIDRVRSQEVVEIPFKMELEKLSEADKPKWAIVSLIANDKNKQSA